MSIKSMKFEQCELKQLTRVRGKRQILFCNLLKYI